jgi:hypothetical protein
VAGDRLAVLGAQAGEQGLLLQSVCA